MQRESMPFIVVVGSSCNLGEDVGAVTCPSLPNVIVVSPEGVVDTATVDVAVHRRSVLLPESTTFHPVDQALSGCTLTVPLRLMASLRANSSAENRSNEADRMPWLSVICRN